MGQVDRPVQGHGRPAPGAPEPRPALPRRPPRPLPLHPHLPAQTQPGGVRRVGVASSARQPKQGRKHGQEDQTSRHSDSRIRRRGRTGDGGTVQRRLRDRQLRRLEDEGRERRRRRHARHLEGPLAGLRGQAQAGRAGSTPSATRHGRARAEAPRAAPGKVRGRYRIPGAGHPRPSPRAYRLGSEEAEPSARLLEHGR